MGQFSIVGLGGGAPAGGAPPRGHQSPLPGSGASLLAALSADFGDFVLDAGFALAVAFLGVALGFVVPGVSAFSSVPALPNGMESRLRPSLLEAVGLVAATEAAFVAVSGAVCALFRLAADTLSTPVAAAEDASVTTEEVVAVAADGLALASRFLGGAGLAFAVIDPGAVLEGVAVGARFDVAGCFFTRAGAASFAGGISTVSEVSLT